MTKYVLSSICLSLICLISLGSTPALAGNLTLLGVGGGPVGPVYACAAAATLFQRSEMATAYAAIPNTPYTILPYPGSEASAKLNYFNDVNTAICAADAAGIYSTLDIWYLFDAPTPATALINLAPSGSIYNGILTLTTDPMLFDPDIGFTGTENQFGANVTEYISTGFNASTATTPNYVQNSAHVSMCVINTRLATASGAPIQFGALTTSGADFSFLEIGQQVSGDNAADQVGLNGAAFGGSTTFGTTGTGAGGYWTIDRAGSANFTSYLNATPLLTITSASDAVPNAIFPVGAKNIAGTISNQTIDTVGEFDSGAGMTGAQIAQFYNINHVYHANRGNLYC
jgi:hypothetical protein